ncbi:MAG: response regulator, partial [Myxococcaceae bacterium]
VAGRGFDVEPCPEPSGFFEALSRAEPRLVVMAAELPGIGGLSLLRAMRADPRYRRLPAIVLSAKSEPGDRLAAFEAGADDFVQVPYLPGELAARAAGLMARSLREAAAGVTDPLTGTFRQGYLLDACARALHLARRGRPLAMMVFDADLEAARGEAGALSPEESVTAIASRLQQSFRTSDVVSRIGEGRFAVLLHDVARADAERLLQSNLAAFGPSSFGSGLAVKVRGAMATFPETSGGAEELLEAAVKALPSRG